MRAVLFPIFIFLMILSQFSRFFGIIYSIITIIALLLGCYGSPPVPHGNLEAH